MVIVPGRIDLASYLPVYC